MDSFDLIHAKIHGLRMNEKYKPSQFEQEINLLISKEYQNECEECKLKLKLLNAEAELKSLRPPQQKPSFLGGLFK